jgi:hypothetical protein
MRGLAIAVIAFTGVMPARADALWCGTFDDERRPLGAVAGPQSLPAGRIPAFAAPPAPVALPAFRVRVEGALIDGARDAEAGRRISTGLALEHCLDAGEVGRGAAWDLDLLVGADGAVIDASVRGELRGVRCLTDRVREIRFSHGAQPRHVSAHVVASPVPADAKADATHATHRRLRQ